MEDLGIWCLILGVIGLVIRSAIRSAGAPQQTTPVQSPSPGRFRIVGVDRSTKLDVVDFIEAASADNAKAKAELSGIVVTRVERS